MIMHLPDSNSSDSDDGVFATQAEQKVAKVSALKHKIDKTFKQTYLVMN